MINLLNQTFGRLTVIQETNKRKNGCVIWKCKCSCGNIVEVKSTDLRVGRKKSCGCLQQENQKAFAERTKKINIKDLTNQRFGRLIALFPTDKRQGTNIIWHCKCDCGQFKDVAGTYLGKTVFSCGCLRKELAKTRAKSLIIDLTGQKFGQLTVLSYVDMPNKKGSYWECLCSCGNKKIVSSKNLKTGKTTSCGCKKIKSKGEQKIASLLKQANIPFVQEKTFDDLTYENNCKPRFDFYVNNQYIIEYDGEQHFKNSFYGDLESIQKKDLYKNLYCKTHKIPIIRIPYTHLDNLTLKDLILKTSNFIIK